MLAEEFNWREIVHEERFDREVAHLAPDVRRADEFVDGTIAALSRDAKVGYQIAPGSPVWMLSVADTPTATPTVVYYTFDEHCIYLLSLQLTKFGWGE